MADNSNLLPMGPTEDGATPSGITFSSASIGDILQRTGATTIGAVFPFQTDGVANTIQNVLNLKAGTNITLTADGSGGVTITSTGGGGGGNISGTISAGQIAVGDGPDDILGLDAMLWDGPSQTFTFNRDIDVAFGDQGGGNDHTTLVGQFTGQTVKNFAIAPKAGIPIVLVNDADLGLDVFSEDLTPFFTAPMMYWASSSPLVQDYGAIMGMGLGGGTSNFSFLGLDGDTVGGTPRAMDGVSLICQTGNAGSLGGNPGNFEIQCGSVSFDGTEAGGIGLLPGFNSFNNTTGKVVVGDNLSIQSSASNTPHLEMYGSTSAPLSGANSGYLRYDTGLQKFVVSENGGAYTPIGSGGGDLVSATLATASGATASTINNSAGVFFNIPIFGVDASTHVWTYGIGGKNMFQVQADGNGVGGATNGLIVLGVPDVPMTFTIQSGNSATGIDATSFGYSGGQGGAANPGASAGHGSDVNWNLGAGGAAADPTRLAGRGGNYGRISGKGGAASAFNPGAVGGSIFDKAGDGGDGSAGQISGDGGAYQIQSGVYGTDGGAGVGNDGNVSIKVGATERLVFIGSNGTVIFTVADATANAFQVRDDSGGNLSYIQVNTSTGSESIQFGNSTSNPDTDFAGNGTFGVHGPASFTDVLTVTQLFTANGGSALNQSITATVGTLSNVEATLTIVDPGADSTAIYVGIQNSVNQNPWSFDLNGQVIGHYTQVFVQPGPGHVTGFVDGYASVISLGTAGTVNEINGFVSEVTNPGAGTINFTQNFFVKNAISSGGSVGQQTGLYMENLTTGVLNYGIVIDGASTKAIWIKGGVSQFDNGIEVNGSQGIFNGGLLVSASAAVFTGRVLEGQGTPVASANDLTLGSDGNTFFITGNTTINAITTTNWAAGAHITLIFQGTPTVKHNTAGGAGTAPMLLQGSVDIAAAANTLLGLVFDGTNWQQEFLKSA